MASDIASRIALPFSGLSAWIHGALRSSLSLPQ